MSINQQCLQGEWRSSWTSAREDEENDWMDSENSEEEDEKAVDDDEGCSASFTRPNNDEEDFKYDDNNNNVEVCSSMDHLVEDDQSQDEYTVGSPDASTSSEGLSAACKNNEKCCDVDEELVPASCAVGMDSEADKYDKNNDEEYSKSSPEDRYRLEAAMKNYADNIDVNFESSGSCKYVDINGNEEYSRSLPATSGNDDECTSKEPEQCEYDEDDRLTTASISTSETGGSEKDYSSEQDLTTQESEEEDDYGEMCSFEDSDDEEDEDDVYTKKLYSDPDYPCVIFKTLENMMLNLVLTDLVLCTEDGQQFQVHSIVLAAVSYYIQTRLRKMARHERGIPMFLGPEVHGSGLAAVVEFAYTGKISNLNKGNLELVWSAAVNLEALDVLELCREEEQREEDKASGKNVKRRRVSAEEHLNIRLEYIRQLWAKRVASDLEVEAEGRVFHAHRVILAASSDYFRGMFTSGMKESRQELVSLLLIRAGKFETLLHYCYSGALALGWGCVFNLASTSLQFQFQTAFSQCIKFLHQEIDAYSCLDVASFAEAYGIVDLLAFANDFVLRHFLDVSITPKFQDLPVEKLKKYLQSDSLCVPSELPVFRAVMAWIEAFPRKRVKLARELMGTIQFHLMTYKEFKEVKSIKSWPRIGARQLYESLLEDFCCGSPDVRTHFRTYMPKHTLVLVGGERITNNLDKRFPCREMWFSNSLQNHIGVVKKVEWRMLGTLPEKPRFSHGVVALRGKLYIVGGRHYYGKDDTMKCTYRYDPMQNSWQRLADMHEKRGSFTLVGLNGKLYAIGGERDSEVNMESVEVYCPNTNSWSFVHPLDHALCCHAASVWNDTILVSGGFDSQYRCLSSMILYHPERGSTYRAKMMKDRALHCMETLGERLYVAGGVSSNADSNLQDQLACEIYDPMANSWSAIMPFSVPHVGSASAVLEGKIYVIGGYSHEDYNETKSVHRYDPATERWENMSLTPGPNTYIAACVLPIPAHLRQ